MAAPDRTRKSIQYFSIYIQHFLRVEVILYLAFRELFDKQNWPQRGTGHVEVFFSARLHKTSTRRAERTCTSTLITLFKCTSSPNRRHVARTQAGSRTASRWCLATVRDQLTSTRRRRRISERCILGRKSLH